jgi:hypothetical protein
MEWPMTEGISELKAMEAAYEALQPLNEDSRKRALRWLLGALEVPTEEIDQSFTPPANLPQATSTATATTPDPSRTLTPKEFIAQKKPKYMAERIACLAYYLEHYRNTSKFKTSDITSLNTDAAQPRMQNASRDVDNADRASGYIVGAGNGAKQMTVRGEALVNALPDRAAVDAALKENPYKRKKGGTSKRTNASVSDSE